MSTSRTLLRSAKRRLLDSLTSVSFTEDIENDVTEISRADVATSNTYALQISDLDDIGQPSNSDSQDFKYFGIEELSSVYESDILSSESDDDPEISLAENLLLFFKLFNISRVAMQFLLDILKQNNLDVPKSVYLLEKITNKTKETHCHEEKWLQDVIFWFGGYFKILSQREFQKLLIIKWYRRKRSY